MTAPVYFCGSLDVRAVRGAAAAWRKREITWRVAGQLPGVGAETFRQAAAHSFAQWAAVTTLAFREASAGEAADVTVTAGPIDGAFGVLAWSELPDGTDRPLTQRYDTGDRFVLAERPQQGQVDLLAVMTHEVGHALGLEHDAADSGSLMAPTYVAGRRAPQANDVARIQQLYGKPARPQPPAPPQPPPAPAKLYWLSSDAKGVITLTPQ